MAIRISKKDRDKINRINQSIRRKNKQMDNFGIGIYKPVIRANEFKTRKQLNEYLSEARTYLRGYGFKYKKNDYGVVATWGEIAKAKRLAKDVSKSRNKRLMKVATKDFTSYGKKTGSSVMQRKLMGDDRYDMYKPIEFNFSSLRTRDQLENRISNLNKQLSPGYIDRKNKILKENIIKAMKRSWGGGSRTTRKWIKSLTPDQVLEYFVSEDVFDFDYIYRDDEVARRIEEFMATFNLV